MGTTHATRRANLNRWHTAQARENKNMLSLPRGSRAWWKKEKQLQQKHVKPCGIPALRKPDGAWALDSKGKADLLAATFDQKCKLPPASDGSSPYFAITATHVSWDVDRTAILTIANADKCLRQLDENSATGPDHCPTKVLKHCHAALAEPLLQLAAHILLTGHWPTQWTEHWIAALYKKKEVFKPGHYRGVHMTSQLAKVMERLLGLLFLPQLSCEMSIGPNQFAYCKKRGSRDALLFLVLSWMECFLRKCRVALYCSDVSGAFDKVDAERLLSKLQARGMPDDLLAVIRSWLRCRTGKVVVAGAESAEIKLSNQVFQGTV